MADNVEQPVTTSVTDEVAAQEAPVATTEAAVPETPAPVEEPKGNRSKSIPRPRFDEVVAERNELRAKADAEAKRARELEAYLQSLQAPPAASQDAGYGDDPLYAEVRQTRQMLAELKRDQEYMRDARQREEFWREHDYVAEDVIEEVETALSEFRSKGLTAVKREDLLDYAIGKRERPNLAKRTKQPAAVPPVNRVAVVEGRPSAVPAPSKRIEDMTPAELNALPLEKLRELMKGKTF